MELKNNYYYMFKINKILLKIIILKKLIKNFQIKINKLIK